MNRIQSSPKPLLWFMALLVGAITGCGGGGGGGDGGSGSGASGSVAPGAACGSSGPTIPKVTAAEPGNGNQFASVSSGAGPGKSITASFSLAMDPASLVAPASTFTLKETASGANVAGTVSMNAGPPPLGALAANLIATFTSTAALATGVSYTATVTSAAKSAAGTAMGCAFAWEFRTALPGTAGAIDLGILGPFGMASAGGMTNLGATKINGDVVLNPAATCNAVAVGSGDDFGLCGGLAPTHNVGDKVTTQIHPDTTTADAVRAVLLTKWNSISPAGTPGATLLGCGTIGTAGGGGAGIGCAGNPTLPPGTYISASGSSIDISGTLTLDALGNANAVWVLQAPSSTVVAAVNSTILLANGAKASNVWWFVGSSATLNAGSTFQGNILASAAISMGTLATSCGRLLSGAEGAGAFTFLSNTVSVPGHPNAPVGCQ